MKKILLSAAMLWLSQQTSFCQNVGFGVETPEAKVDINGDLALKQGPALNLNNGENANVNLATNKFSFYRITGPSAAFSISGFTGGNDGRIVTIYNSTSHALTIINQGASSTDVNRIKTIQSADMVSVAGNSSVTMMYSGNEQRWLVTGFNNFYPKLAWSTAGNAGTNPANNFIGTTDAQGLSVKTNNAERLNISSNGTVTVSYLAGTGQRQVVADANGVLSATTTVGSNGSAGSAAVLSCNGTISSGLVTVGSGTASSSLSNTPFCGSNGSHDSRRQYIISADELLAAGMKPGNITSIALRVGSAGSNLLSLNIKLKNTSSTSLTAFETGTTVVYTSANQNISGSNNWNTFTLSGAFNWDGTSNLLVEICHDNTTNGTVSSVYGSTCSPNYSYGGYRNGATTPCTQTSWSNAASTEWRPDFRFGCQTIAAPTCADVVKAMRIVHGTVNKDATVGGGGGYSVQLLSDHVYEVTFTTPFTDLPTVTATVIDPSHGDNKVTTMGNEGNPEHDNLVILGVSRARFRVQTGPGDEGTDNNFSFIAIGTN